MSINKACLSFTFIINYHCFYIIATGNYYCTIILRNLGAKRAFIAFNSDISSKLARRSRVSRPDLYAVLVNNPGGKFKSILSIISFDMSTLGSLSDNIFADYAYASIIYYASLSRSVFVPPLCFIFIWRFWLPSEPKNLSHASKGHMNSF